MKQIDPSEAEDSTMEWANRQFYHLHPNRAFDHLPFGIFGLGTLVWELSIGMFSLGT